MKHTIIVALLYALLIVALIASLRRVASLRKEFSRASTNVEALSSELERFRLLDSLNGVKLATLVFRNSELERLRAADASLIRSLRIKPRDVQNIVKTETLIRDTVVVAVTADSCFSYSDYWASFDACIPTNQLSYSLRDSLTTILYVHYKRKFLWFRWKPHYETIILNHNPNSTISYSESIIMQN